MDETRLVCQNIAKKDKDLSEKLDKLEELKQKASYSPKFYFAFNTSRMLSKLFACKSS